MSKDNATTRASASKGGTAGVLGAAAIAVAHAAYLGHWEVAISASSPIVVFLMAILIHKFGLEKEAHSVEGM